MAIYHIYGDESGKLSGGSEITSFCGYVAHISAWATFAQNWTNARHKWQVPPLHMSRIMFPDSKDDVWKQIKGEWGTLWEKKRDLMLRDFGELIRMSDIDCIGALVDARYFRSLADADPLFKEAHRDPIHMAFHTFVMRGLDRIEVTDKCAPVGIVIDDDHDFSVRAYEQLESLKATFPRVRERVHAISFVNDSSYPGVQAADMIAYEARSIMVKKMTDPDATSELYDNLTFLRTHQPQFYNKKVLDELAATNPLKEQGNAPSCE